MMLVKCSNDTPYHFCTRCGNPKPPDAFSFCEKCREWKDLDRIKRLRKRRRMIDADTLLTMLRSEQEHSPSVGLQKAIAMVEGLSRQYGRTAL